MFIVGYYYYIEVSSPRKLGDKARIISPDYQPSTKPQCFNFYYHMWGSHIGTLNVYSQANNDNKTLLWTKTTDQGNQWSKGQATLPAQTGTFKVCPDALG